MNRTSLTRGTGAEAPFVAPSSGRDARPPP